MRCAYRNKQSFWYALFDATEEGRDEHGYQNAAYPTYHDPVLTSGNISPAKGDVVARQFGDDDLYDKVILLGDRETQIDENTVLWIDVTPELDGNGALVLDRNGRPVTPHNYIVRRVAKSLPQFGSALIAVDKVTVT